jgi:hypothetical protein
MERLVRYDGWGWGVCLEYDLKDMWIGVTWEHGKQDIDIWLCIFPCFAIHYWSGRDYPLSRKVSHNRIKSNEKQLKKYPHGDPRCECNNGEDCWVSEVDPEYACYGVENCPEGHHKTEEYGG